MTKYNKYYEHYITPVLSNLDNTALERLNNDILAHEYLQQMRSSRFRFKNKASREIMISQLYWCVLRLYSNTNFMCQTKAQVPDDICTTIDSKTGKCTLPKRYRSVLRINYDKNKGYYGIVNTPSHNNLKIKIAKGQGNNARALIDELSGLPLLPIEEMLLGFKKLGQIAELVADDEHNSQKIIEEYRVDCARVGRILKVQDKIREIRNDTAKKIKDLQNNPPKIDDAKIDGVTFYDSYRATQNMCTISILMLKSQATEELKTLSGIPLCELEYARMRRGCK